MLDYKKLKQLRSETGVSFSTCKKALEETKNDMAAAKEKLKQWGETKAKEKAGRVTTQGVIASYVHHNRKVAAMIELDCETDFVAGNQEFQALAQEIAMQAASMGPETTTVEAFLKTEYIRDPGKTVNDLIKEAVLKFGENIKLKRFIKWQV
ncbi:translation elongation factor Ts [Patescibacteria group bacterium]|nr:translation elongation factor Ts [Patescibacteria group bacterium]MCL5091836.1 translation elongation factor Ts [Patescibacteria group bacterium]